MTLYSCIACKSAAWVLGGVRLISSPSTMLAKIGPLTNFIRRRPVPSSSSSTSVPVMSEGMRSGVNWILPKCERQEPGDARDHQRLGQPRHALEDAVALAKQRDQDLLEHIVLTDDHPGEFPGHLAVNLGQHLRRPEIGRIGLGPRLNLGRTGVSPSDQGIVPLLHPRCLVRGGVKRKSERQIA